VRPRPIGVLMAIGSGVAIGIFLVVIDQTPDDSGLVPLVLNRAVSGAILFAAVGVLFIYSRSSRSRSEPPSRSSRSRSEPPSRSSRSRSDRIETPDTRGWRPGLRLAIICGIVDAAANTGLLIGLRLGELSVMAVLTALYPAGTIILAAIVLKERIAPVQIVGLVLAVAAGALLALA